MHYVAATNEPWSMVDVTTWPPPLVIDDGMKQQNSRQRKAKTKEKEKEECIYWKHFTGSWVAWIKVKFLIGWEGRGSLYNPRFN